MSNNASLPNPITEHSEILKEILCSVFKTEKSILSSVTNEKEIFPCIQINTVKPITYDEIEDLHRKLYENKFILKYSFKRSGKGIRVLLY